MNITVDKTNKTITVDEDITITDFNGELGKELSGHIVSGYKILATKKVTEYIPVSTYPFPYYPVNPYPCPYYPAYPSPSPYWAPYTVTCNVKTNIT